MASSCEVIHINAWGQLRETLSGAQFRSWAFRGQSDASWPVLSTLSRRLVQRNVHPDLWPQQESRILRIFKRKAHLFISQPPADDDAFEWLSIMQHHGAPTRLVDFTWSPHVAAFFSLDSATKTAAIWAIPPTALLPGRSVRTTVASQTVADDEVGPWVIGNYEKHFLKNQNRIVLVGEPHRMNQRLIAQSGTFAIPGLLDTPVEQIAPVDSIVKLEIDVARVRKEAMSELYKMNISNATLFPGLDGLARSLGYELEFHWAFDPETKELYPGFRQ
jgi:hypothetical protein